MVFGVLPRTDNERKHKMKKKILSIAVCAAVVLLLTACGKSENPPASQPETSSGSTVSAPNNSKPAAISTPAASSVPVVSCSPDSTPDTSSTPEAPKETDWSTVPYTDEFDLMVQDVNGGVQITQYLGKDTIGNNPDSVTHLGSTIFVNCSNIKVNYKGKKYDYNHITRLYSDINGN